MDQVDFGYVGRGGLTIYISCLQRYLSARFVQDRDGAVLNRHEAAWKKLVTKAETVFYFLVEEGIKCGFDVDSILEIPTSNGSTCFSDASRCSKRILDYIIERGIKVNCIQTNMMVPAFKYPDLTIPMMKEGINPHVINCDGLCQIDLYPTRFESEESKRLLAHFPRSIHFSIEDISCENTCPSDCSSKFEKFYFKNGEFAKMTDANRIGQGGFGSVFKGLFHGKEKAMKCVLIGQIQNQLYSKNAVSDLEKNISEIRIQMASGGSGITVPEAFVRQQNQEQDQNGIWIAENYNIFIYPLYDCNLYELHENHFDQFNDEISIDILKQCLTRECSNRIREG